VAVDLAGATASLSNARWCGDITYVPTWQGWLYLATVIDIASRRVVGFAMADHLRTELVADALTNAVAGPQPRRWGDLPLGQGLAIRQPRVRHPRRRPRHHPLGRAHRAMLGQRPRRVLLRRAQGRMPPQRAWPTRAAARRAIVDYIAWFNSTRLHSSLGYQTPNEFEAAARKDDLAKVA
jgi:putative transposase